MCVVMNIMCESSKSVHPTGFEKFTKNLMNKILYQNVLFFVLNIQSRKGQPILLGSNLV